MGGCMGVCVSQEQLFVLHNETRHGSLTLAINRAQSCVTATSRLISSATLFHLWGGSGGRVYG